VRTVKVRTARPRRRVRVGVFLLILGFSGLGVCWAVTNPIGSSPDEPDQYIKALAAAQGEFFGRPLTTSERVAFSSYGVPEIQYWLRVAPLTDVIDQGFTIPYRLQPNGAGCTAGQPVTANCIDDVAHGRWGHGRVAYTDFSTYQPYVYVVPGLVMINASSPREAFLLGRLTFLVIAVLLIVAGCYLAMLVGPGLGGLLGVLTCLAPMVIFISAMVSSSSTEIASGIAVFGAVLHLAYGGSRQRLAWTVLGIGGALLGCTRSLGPGWVVLALVLGVVLVGWRRAMDIVRQARPRSTAAAGALILGCAAGVTWQLAVQPRPPFSGKALGLALVHGFQQIPTVLQQEVGIFGWLDTTQAGLSYVIWGGLFVGLVTIALFLGSRREKWALGLLIASNILVVPVFNAFFAAPVKSGVQGRWLLPMAVAMPLLSGVVIGRNLRPDSVSARNVGVWIAAAVGAVQFLALYQNGRRYAVGPTGPLWFFPSSMWSPQLGWVFWLIVAAVCCTAIVVASGMIVWREWPSEIGMSSPDRRDLSLLAPTPDSLPRSQPQGEVRADINT